MLIILLLQLTLPVEGIEIELLPPLRGFIQHPLQEGGVRLADGDKLISLRGSKVERILGVPRLIQQTKETVITLKLQQTWLPATRMDISVADFNNLAFHLGFTYTIWESSCDPVDEFHRCLFTDLVPEFLYRYGTVPEAWPGDDEWVVNRRAW